MKMAFVLGRARWRSIKGSGASPSVASPEESCILVGLSPSPRPRPPRIRTPIALLAVGDSHRRRPSSPAQRRRLALALALFGFGLLAVVSKSTPSPGTVHRDGKASSRSSEQGLPDRSEVHPHHLHPHQCVLPEDVFVNIAMKVGSELNRLLAFLQDVAVEGNLKQFIITVASLWSAAILGSWSNFLTVIYVALLRLLWCYNIHVRGGFQDLLPHRLPVVYEKYEDEIESFLENLIEQAKSQYSKMNKKNGQWSKSE